MALTLLTKPPHSYIYSLINSFRPQRGPQVVLNSLIKGLNELDVKYILNPNKISDTAIVLQNTNALRLAINLKKQGKIKKLLAGPNIVVTPKDADNILENPLIDKIIVPSQWVKDFYSSLSPIIKDKIYIWSAGVDNPSNQASQYERDTILIYQKNASIDMFNRLVEKLSPQSGIPLHLVNKLKAGKVHPVKSAESGVDQFNRVNKVDIIKYGKYKQTEYFEKLNNAKLVIFLTQSESQGIAQQEAWIRDVPTLIWNPGKWQYNEYSWQDEKISSPYLTDACGTFFTSIEEFDIKINEMLNNLENFSPREYALNNFTHRKSAQKFIEIIDY